MANQKLIIITGSPCVGKTTVADELLEKLENCAHFDGDYVINTEVVPNLRGVFMDNTCFNIRVTGLLVEDFKVLLVKQKVANRNWSLPCGKVEAGETLDKAIIRELFEETGITVQVEKLLYVCDKTDCSPPILHITFLLRKVKGEIALPTNEFDENPISDVSYVEFSMLSDLGFSQKFIDILENNFPNAGSYMGLKENIGL